MKKNPVYIREVMRTLRAPRMILSIFVLNVALTVVGIFSVSMAVGETAYGSRMDYSIILTLYQIIAAVEWGMVMIMMPPLTAGAISGERERNTLEILLTTDIRFRSIVAGKLEAALSTILTLIVSTLPVLSLVFVYGGIRFFSLLELILVLAATAFYVGSICLLFSAFAKTTTFSLICSYGTILVLTAGLGFAAYMLARTFGSRVGMVPYSLLFNPAFTFFVFIHEQVGNYGQAYAVMDLLGIPSQGTLGRNWIFFSILFQLALSFACIYLAAAAISPRKRLYRSEETEYEENDQENAARN